MVRDSALVRVLQWATAPSGDGPPNWIGSYARPPAARRELADIGNILEATIRFSGIENEGTRK